MYLASFRYRDRERIGARVDDDRLIDFRDAADVRWAGRGTTRRCST